MDYTESYMNLSHGTDAESAEKILENGFKKNGDCHSWCGSGVYFYDIKAKAWWSANRTCSIKNKNALKKLKAKVIFADIINISREHVFDMRVNKDLELFEKFFSEMFNDFSLQIPNTHDELEKKIILRSIMISFFSDRMNRKLVIGNFKQSPRSEHVKMINFADSLDMVFGIETIYCIKDITVLSNIH